MRKRRAASQEVLIKRLNPLIQGWGNYYATVTAKRTFPRMHGSEAQPAGVTSLA